MKKRLFCLITAIALMLGLLPLAASADDGSAASVTVNGATTTYNTLCDAIEFAQHEATATITLLKDIEEIINIYSGDIILDLNGKLWSSNGYTLTVKSDSRLKITDGKGGGIIQTTSNSCHTIDLDDTATLELAGGAVKNMSGTPISSMPSGNYSNSHLIISGGYVITQSWYAIQMGGSTLTISGGNLVSEGVGVYITSGKVDLSSHPAPQTITLQVGSAAINEISLINGTLLLPDGYTLYREGEPETPVNVMERDYLHVIDFAPIAYDIYTTPSANGSIQVIDSGYPNQLIPFFVIPNAGYVVEGITVVDENDVSAELVDGGFIMPHSNVTVNATFRAQQFYTASLTVGENGTATLPSATLGETDTVGLTVTPNEGYAIDTITVTDADGNKIPVDGASFVMPSSNVTIHVTFCPPRTYSITVPDEYKDMIQIASNATEGAEVSFTLNIPKTHKLDSLYVDHIEGGISETVDTELGYFTMPSYDVVVKLELEEIFDVYIGETGLSSGKYLPSGRERTTTEKPAEGGYAHYANGVLTLHNFTAAPSDLYILDNEDAAILYHAVDLEIKLEGTNRLLSDFSLTYGITSEKKLTISGSGLLYIIADIGIELTGDASLTIQSDNLIIYSNLCAIHAPSGIEMSEVSILYPKNTSYDANVGSIIDEDDEFAYHLALGKEITHTWAETYSYNYYDHWHRCTDENCYVNEFIWLCNGYEEHQLGENGVCEDCDYDTEKEADVYIADVGISDGEYLTNDGKITTTKPQSGYAYYNNGKLTLNNFKLIGNTMSADLIYAHIHLQIELIGENALIQTSSDGSPISTIFSNLLITGDGSLTIHSLDDGIYLGDGSMTIHSGKITIEAFDDGIDIEAGNLLINGGELNISAGDHGVDLSYGDVVSALGNVVINGGKITINAGDDGVNADSGTITITNGTIDIVARDIPLDTSFGFYISGGDLNLISETDDGIETGGNAIFNGGNVRIEAADVGIDVMSQVLDEFYTVAGGNLILNGGNVYVSAEDQLLYVESDLILNGGYLSLNYTGEDADKENFSALAIFGKIYKSESFPLDLEITEIVDEYDDKITTLTTKDGAALIFAQLGEHDHTLTETNRSFDENSHWRDCLCGEQLDLAAHSDLNGDALCDTCGASYAVVSDQPSEQPNDQAPQENATTPATKETSDLQFLIWVIPVSAVLMGGAFFALYWFIARKKETPVAEVKETNNPQ